MLISPTTKEKKTKRLDKERIEGGQQQTGIITYLFLTPPPRASACCDGLICVTNGVKHDNAHNIKYIQAKVSPTNQRTPCSR